MAEAEEREGRREGEDCEGGMMTGSPAFCIEYHRNVTTKDAHRTLTPTFLPRWETELCWPLHTRMAVRRAVGRFSFCRSESGMRHSTASVSGFTPGGSGVGTPGLIGSVVGVGCLRK
jgi:hypothetical protein